MFSKLGEAISLLIRHFGLIAAVVLTVWLPGNLLIGYINFFLPAPENELNAFRAAMFIEGIFGPIYIGAMIHALWQIKQEEAVGYGEALRVGFQNWGRLFAARFIAGIFILLGLIAFIVPGVVLTLRYAFLDSVVVLEEAGSDEARRRSTRLTEGLKLQILIMSTVFYIGFIVAAMMVYVPIALAEEIAQLGLPVAVLLEVGADCVLDLVFAVLQIAVFLYYWDARVQEMPDEPVEPENTPNDLVKIPTELGEVDDNGNPYRSPQL